MTDFATHTDERGTLLPVELDDLPFAVRRVFVVTGPPEGSTRGGHDVPCRQLVVVVSGEAEVTYAGRTRRLDRPGATMLLEPGGEVRYHLAPGGSSILVLADQRYGGPR